MKKINQKYPLGYLPKIEYWTDQLIEGTKTSNEELIKKSNEKIKYFLEKEKQRLSFTNDNQLYQTTGYKQDLTQCGCNDPNHICHAI